MFCSRIFVAERHSDSCNIICLPVFRKKLDSQRILQLSECLSAINISKHKRFSMCDFMLMQRLVCLLILRLSIFIWTVFKKREILDLFFFVFICSSPFYKTLLFLTLFLPPFVVIVISAISCCFIGLYIRCSR